MSIILEGLPALSESKIKGVAVIMDIYVQAQLGICNEFIYQGKKQPVSTVISPLKITQIDQTLRVSSGCNMWKACDNLKCQYSIASHNASQKLKVKQ